MDEVDVVGDDDVHDPARPSEITSDGRVRRLRDHRSATRALLQLQRDVDVEVLGPDRAPTLVLSYLRPKRLGRPREKGICKTYCTTFHAHGKIRRVDVLPRINADFGGSQRG